jgi:PAS domain S-box-containing protein
MDAGTGLLITARDVTAEVAREVAAAKARANDSNDQKVELLSTERLLKDIIDGSPSIIFLKDADGRFITINKQLEVLLGISREELKGKTDFDIFPKEKAEYYRAHDRQVLESGQTLQVEEIADLADGKRHVFLANKFPLRGASGRIYGTCGISHDITERKAAEDALSQLNVSLEGMVTERTKELVSREQEARRLLASVQEEKERFASLINSISDEVWFVDTQKRFALANPAAVRAFALGPGNAVDVEQLAASLEVLRPDGSPRPVEEAPPLRALKGEFVRNEEESIRTPVGGELRHREVSSSPVRNGQGTIIGSLSVVRDVTERKRAEDAVRESEERFRTMADGAPVMIWVANSDGGMEFVNRRYREFFGVSYEQVRDARWQPLIHPDDAASYVTAVQQSVQGRKPFAGETRVRRFDGEWRWVTSHAEPRYSPSGDFFGHIGISFDITDRKQAGEALRQSEKLYRAIGESIDYGVWVCAPDGRNTYASESFLKLVGITQEQCSQFGWGDVLHPDDAERTIAAWKECVRTGGQWDIEHRFRGVDGRWHPILARGVPVKNEQGVIVCWAGINLDIGNLKDAENELREANRRKDEFLGMLSHELRNPLTPIRNAIYILERADPGGDQAGRARSVIKRQTDHLTQLVDELLDVTRIARGKIELRRERVNLRELVWGAADDFRLMLDDRGVTFRTVLPDGDVWADADATRITQVIGNLLHNAAKFTERGDEVLLSLRAGDGEAEIAVRDTGQGIDPVLLPHVFEAFVQGDRTLARTDGGLGLGLALVKGIIDLHGGTVRAESAGKGKGAEFTVRVPAVTVAAMPEELHSVIESTNNRRLVLVVDDSHDAAETLAEIVGMLGHTAEVAFDGPSAIEKAQAIRPDVVLCDIGLPGMSGHEVAKALRANGTKGMLLIAVSGYAQPEDVKKAVEAGFDGHVAKPPDPAEIERLLG